MSTATTDRIHELLADAVERRVFPGAVWAHGTLDDQQAGSVGLLDPARPERPMQPDTIFDLASLTKVLAVWAPLGALYEHHELALDQPLEGLLPATRGYPLAAVTVGHLLTHTAGVPLRANLRQYGTTRELVETGVLREALHRPPGEAVEYTDRASLILGFLLEHALGEPLDRIAANWVSGPLGMAEIGFGPLGDGRIERCAPTELDPDTGQRLRGSVHDYSARLLDGVCGIAGAFGTLDDLVRFLRHLLDPTATPTVAFGQRWIETSLRVRTGALEPARGLMWLPAPNTSSAQDIWCHYGFTGTAMWVSPRQHRWAVLLTNKLYYTRDREPIGEVRDRFRALAFQAFSPPAPPPGGAGTRPR